MAQAMLPPSLSQWSVHSSPRKDHYTNSPTSRPKWHQHKKQELLLAPGFEDACGAAFQAQDRLLSRGALDAAQCRRGFGQVLLRLFPNGPLAEANGALLDRVFSECDEDLDGLLNFKEFQQLALRGLQPILRGASVHKSEALQAAQQVVEQQAMQSVQMRPFQPQISAVQAQTEPKEEPAPFAGLKGAQNSSAVSFVAAGNARDIAAMLQEYEIPEGGALGSGAFGTVLKVKHHSGEERACKAVRLEQGEANKHLRELVELEISMLKSLDHVNLLRLHEAFRDGQRCVYLVTELCAGGSLAQRLDAQRAQRRLMLEGQAAAYAEQILAAASYCHRRGVLHRDLKPENVLFLTNRADSLVKVIDFGLSDTLERLRANCTKELQDRSGALGAVARLLPKLPGGLEILATKVTKEVMQRAGTPHYMAPEVYEGQYGDKADVWSIGVMIFEMLSNRHPFYSYGNDLEAVRGRILRPSGADFCDAAWGQVSPAARRACQRALEPAVAKRPSSKDLLGDNWFETVPRLALGYDSAWLSVDAPQVLSAMQRFAFPGYIGATRTRLRQALLRLVARELPERLQAPLRGAFLKLDRDADGTLSVEDLAGGRPETFLSMLGLEAKQSNDEEIRSLMAVAGSLEQGMSFLDFVAVMLPSCLKRQEPLPLQAAFRRLDLQNRGRVQRQSLQEMLQVGQGVSAEELADFNAGLPEELTMTDFLELLAL